MGGVENVADEATMGSLERARLTLLPESEGVDDLLVGQVESGLAQTIVFGLDHLDVKTQVVANQ